LRKLDRTTKKRFNISELRLFIVFKRPRLVRGFLL